MRRNMQNLSFLAIIGVLLSCAFFISQQTQKKTSDSIIAVTETEVFSPETLDDLPDCEGLESDEESLSCYSEAVALSESLIDAKVDEILSLEADSEGRLAFMEVQLAWEDSRDADCDYVKEMTSEEVEAALQEAICIYNHNLSRYDQLQTYYCEWYDASSCEEDE